MEIQRETRLKGIQRGRTPLTDLSIISCPQGQQNWQAMVMKEACSLLLLLGLAWMTEWTAADLASFERQSVDYNGDPMASYTDYRGNYCNKTMKQRGLNHKRSNVFIHNSVEDIKEVCTDEGGVSTRDGERWSKYYFRITTCHAYGPSTNGVYSNYDTYTNAAIIAIECENGEPSRYVRTVIVAK